MKKTAGLCALLFAASLLCAAETVKLPLETVENIKTSASLVFPGKVCAVQQVDIVPQVSGEIKEVVFTNGAIVEAGTILYRIDKLKYQAAVKNASALVTERKAKKAYAEAAYQRHLKLSGLKAVSEDAVENALSERDRAQADLEAAEADLLVAEDNLEHCEIKAPIRGKLGTTRLTQGNYVTPQSGTLVTLVQTQPIRVRFSLSNSDLISMFGGKSRTLREKGAVKVILPNGGEFPEEGEIEYTENLVDEATDTIRVFALFKNEERLLRPGGTVGVELRNKGGVMKTAVSQTAVMQGTKGAYVWVVGKDGAVRKRPVERGAAEGDRQIIESGLEAGETVVLDGVHKVKEGQKVIAPEE